MRENNSKKLKILVGYHKRSAIFHNEVMLPILLGSTLQSIVVKQFFKQELTDEAGENISHKNPYYSELTALYYAWKNLKKLNNPDYIGFMHYRRFLQIDSNETLDISTLIFNLDSYTNKIKKLIETNVDLIVPQKEEILCEWVMAPQTIKELGMGTVMSMEEHYKFSHIAGDFDKTFQILKKIYPKIFEVAKKSRKGTSAYFCNMFIAKRQIFEDMMSFVFTILFELEKQRNNWQDKVYQDNYQQRVAGFIAERLISIYIDYLYSLKKFNIIEKPKVFINNNEGHIVNKNTINIFSASSKHYGQQLAVMITSILCNAKPEDHFNFYVFDFGIKETDKTKLSKLKKARDFNIEYIKIPTHLLQKLHSLADIFSTCGYIDESTYARLFIAELFPNMQQCLYLDCDLVVNESLQELWSYNLKKATIGGVRDALAYTSKTTKKRLNISKNAIYVNAGVLKINIQKMKQIDVYKTILAHNKHKKIDIQFGDQDILNIVFDGKICELPLKYNMNAHFFAPLRKDVVIHTKEEKEFYKKVANYKTMGIVHYFGPNKPWKDSRYWAPNKKIWLWYWHYCKKSPQKNTVFQYCGRDLRSQYHRIISDNFSRNLVIFAKQLLILTKIIFRMFFILPIRLVGKIMLLYLRMIMQ